jgi:hypothetical protein
MVQSFEAKYKAKEAVALFIWAAWSVDSLYYLDDLDRKAYKGLLGSSRELDMIDVAHARWATMTSITALDLGAAGLGRAFCGHSGPRELGLIEFDLRRRSSAKKRAERLDRRKQLPDLARDWIDAACNDPRYTVIKQARNALIHAWMNRQLYEPRERVKLKLPTKMIGVRELMDDARNYAERHVSELFQIVPKL